MELNQITEAINGAAIAVHRALGPGLLESCYAQCLRHELQPRGIPFENEKELSAQYMGKKLDCGYRLDLIVAGQVAVAIKSMKRLERIHEAQLLTYLRLERRKVGLLINFNVPVPKDGIKRPVQDLNEPGE
jgi:GxxExxY protein